MTHLAQGMANAAALISRAVLDETHVLPLADQVAAGDATRETLAALAALTSGLALAIADLRLLPVDVVLGDICGEVAARIDAVGGC